MMRTEKAPRVIAAVLFLSFLIPLYVYAEDTAPATAPQDSKIQQAGQALAKALVPKPDSTDQNDENAGQAVKQVTVEASPSEEAVEKKVRPGMAELEATLTQSALASDVVGARPDPPGTPTEVNISMYVFDISAINDAKQTFDTDFQIIYRWFDPRLAKHDDKYIRQMDIDDIWNPVISIMNLREFTYTNEDLVFVDAEGHCIYIQRYLAKLTVPLNLRNFPNDKHRLYIQARSLYSPDEVKLVIDKETTGWSSVLSIPDWAISDGQAKINSSRSDPQNMEMAQMEFSFKIERFIGFYFWKIIFPLFLIVLMSWGVFWIDPRRLEAQLALSATAVLTLIAFQFAIANLVPRVSYLTRMDKFTMLSSIIIFLALIVAILTAYFAKKEWHYEALIIERVARILFPLAFVGIILYAFVL